MTTERIEIVKNFITEEECLQLSAWCKEAESNGWMAKGIGVKADPLITTDYSKGSFLEGRKTTRLYGNLLQYPEVAYKVFDKIKKVVPLERVALSAIRGETLGKDGIVVNKTYPGYGIQEHKDPYDGKNHILRCNILTQKSESGGKLFVNNKQVDIDVGDLHCYVVSEHSHRVEVVDGNKARILWMFGFFIDSPQDWDSGKIQLTV